VCVCVCVCVCVYIYIYIYIYINNSQDTWATIIVLNKLEIIKNFFWGGGGFRFEVLSAGLWVVTPCNLVESL